MKKHISAIILVLLFVIGLSLLLYPSLSDWWNSFHQTQAITYYMEQLADMDETQYEQLWQSAWAYNDSLVPRTNQYILSSEQKANYHQLLNVAGDGIMGYVEIPKINVMLPIYHGTEESALQVAIGHLEWTSLPVGGESSHCVISGHRGLPSARLFTDLPQLEIGDTFTLTILDEVLTYQVDQIRSVEPQETEELLIQEGKDLCTLMTCTPYGINSHRMLVRGSRIETVEAPVVRPIVADASQFDPVVVAPLLAAPILLGLLIALMVPKSKKKNKEK